MYPYTKKLTLDEALQLPKDTVVYSGCANPQDLNNFYISTHYDLDGKLFCTSLDYATHILKQQTPPEGWGYAAYELSSGKYDTLDYKWLGELSREWNIAGIDSFKHSKHSNWNVYIFPLTDLAKVEVESEAAPIQPTTDWEAKYNSLLIDEKQLQEERNTWRNKYSELADRFNAQAQESSNLFLDATERATLQDSLLEAQNTIAIQEKRIRELEYYKSISDDYVKAFERRDAAKENLKQAEINLIEARNEYYPY